jgi:carbon-monoxide dehydrogenase large subunit
MQVRIGDAVHRKEDARLLVGRGCYSDDINLPDQAYAAVLRSPHAHALIRAIDVEAARAMPNQFRIPAHPARRRTSS